MPADELDRLLGWLEAHGVLDRLWLTFDDGWLSVGESVPVLEKYNVRAKVFIAPGETIRGRVWTSAAIGSSISHSSAYCFSISDLSDSISAYR